MLLCTTMVSETIKYHSSNAATPVYLSLLDASKAFDKVTLYTLFNMLVDIILPVTFNISNGVTQGGIISPLLSAYTLIICF